METRHPAEGSLGSEIPAICNHCGAMAAGHKSKNAKNAVK